MELVKYVAIILFILFYLSCKASIRYETFRKRKRNGNECNKGKRSNVLFQ